MKGISKSRLFTFFGCQRLDWLEIKVVVQVQVVEILAMDEEVEHVESLTGNLETCFNPINFCRLKKLCGFQLAKEVLLIQRFWRFTVKFIQNVVFLGC